MSAESARLFVPEPSDALAINTIRALAADVVQKANSGHPGAPMGCAPIAHILFSRFIRASPNSDKSWINRDRFVLSNGHACVLQYIMLHLTGSPTMGMDQLRSFRQLGSLTPGHPEPHITPGIEVATGPLGQGISSAVGLAIAQANLGATYNRTVNLFDNFTYVLLGDGCLQEGVSSEACSLAGHLRLGRLIVLYDDNHITIDGKTDLSFTENVEMRFEAYGWHTSSVDCGDRCDNEALAAIHDAIEAARRVTNKPSLIRVRTTIGFSSTKAGTDKVHGAPLGEADIVHVKKSLGLDPTLSFNVPHAVYELYNKVNARNAAAVAAWQSSFNAYKAEYIDLASEITRRLERKLPENLLQILPRYDHATKTVAATRKLSENVLNAIAPHMPELIGGSADLTSSNLTRWSGALDFQHPDTKLGSYEGRYIRFGVREHAMAAISNGMAAYGMIIPFCATFLNFISYALGAVRLSALSHQRVIYVMTHDSIGLGEDGPTHQPIETLAGLRATPNILVFRPADGNEVTGSYYAALTNSARPSVLALSRQNVTTLKASSPDFVLLGAYVVFESAKPRSPTVSSSAFDAVVVATGTEVQLAIDGAEKAAQLYDLAIRVVSMPCCELFDAQSYEYRISVFPIGVPILSVEALTTYGWERYAHVHMGVNTFGLSAPAPEIYRKFGLTADNIAAKLLALNNFYSTMIPPNKMLRDAIGHPCGDAEH